jgi:hypothetical protein
MTVGQIMGSARWSWVLLVGLFACEMQSEPHEGVQINDGICNYEYHTRDVQVEVRAQPIPDQNPPHFVLSIKIVNEGTFTVSLPDPRILPSDIDPLGPAKPHYPGEYPPFVLRVAQLDSDIVGMVPREWIVLLPNLPPPAGEPQPLVLDAGESLQTSVQWIAPKPGHYVLEGTYYGGGWPHPQVEARCHGNLEHRFCWATAFAEWHFEVPAT